MRTVAQLLDEKGTDVWTVPPDATVYQMLEMLADKDVGALLVMAGEELLGIVSERDYARKVVLRDRSSKKALVSDIMTSEVSCVTPEQSVDECMSLMTDRRIRHLPVLVEGKVAGMISIGDVVRAMISEQQFMIQQLERYITS